ncbi:MAG: peptidoglycan-binding domain-containing protein [Dongiaceae bacterium]
MNAPRERQEPRLGNDPIVPSERFGGLAAADRPVASRDNARGGGPLLWLILVAVIAAGAWAIHAWTDLDDSLLALLDPATPGLESVDLVYETEMLLDELGLMPGRIDGELDPVTVDSIRLYQESAGLPVTGEPSRDLLEDMRAVAAEIDSEQAE